MISEWWLLLLPVAAGSGWYAAVHKPYDSIFSRHKSALPRNYLQGLNFLLNEEPDKALDVFIKLLEIDSDTVETHLALGNLFRRRGEVNRAIRIHQNLIARPNLDKKYRAEAMAALAKDYFSAGVFDRAERLFLELIEFREEEKTALRYLLDIYQQEKEWQKALDIVQQLSRYADNDIRVGTAHYYCELTKIAMGQNDFDRARKFLKRAFSIDRKCVRASLLAADLAMAEGRHRKALRYLKHIKNQDPDYLSEAILPIMNCYRALYKEEDAIKYFKGLLREFPKMPIVIVLSEQIRQWRGDQMAANFVAEYVRNRPSLAGVHHLVQLRLPLLEGRVKSDVMLLHELLQKMVDEHAAYQCIHCGFASKALQWQCPGCRKWGTRKPTHVLDEVLPTEKAE